MKKSMLALFGCALVAGSVMAADVAGNNIAVVIQKEAVVSSNLYQFLIVPVKGFDITGNGTNLELSLNELLPPSLYFEGTSVYKATEDNPTVYVVSENKTWIQQGTEADAGAITFDVNNVLWLKFPNGTVLDDEENPIPDTVFCGELANDTFTVTPGSGLTPFGNATSTAKKLRDLFVDLDGDGIKGENDTPKNGDAIYVVQANSSEYARYLYNGGWKQKGPTWQMIDASTVEIPAGGAAYYLKK